MEQTTIPSIMMSLLTLLCLLVLGCGIYRAGKRAGWSGEKTNSFLTRAGLIIVAYVALKAFLKFSEE